MRDRDTDVNCLGNTPTPDTKFSMSSVRVGGVAQAAAVVIFVQENVSYRDSGVIGSLRWQF